MKTLEEKTLDEILSTNNQEEIKKYYEYYESLKSSKFTKELVEDLFG